MDFLYAAQKRKQLINAHLIIKRLSLSAAGYAIVCHVNQEFPIVLCWSIGSMAVDTIPNLTDAK